MIFYQYPFYKYDKGLKKAYLLAEGSEASLPTTEFRRAVTNEVPPTAPDPINSVVAVEYY